VCLGTPGMPPTPVSLALLSRPPFSCQVRGNVLFHLLFCFIHLLSVSCSGKRRERQTTKKDDEQSHSFLQVGLERCDATM
jgi:hypothetical protein